MRGYLCIGKITDSSLNLSNMREIVDSRNLAEEQERGFLKAILLNSVECETV